MNIAVWMHCHGPESGGRSAELSAALSAAGVAMHKRDADANAPGIVLFDTVDAALLAAVRQASNCGESLVIAICTTPMETTTAWSLLQAGAADVLQWSDDASFAVRVASRLSRWIEVERTIDSPVVSNNLRGASQAWRRALRSVVEAARFTDAPVLICGESGTGKELAARLIHTLDPRPRKRDLVVLDCTTIVADLAGSELFGHERGAFTGALAARDGAFALADGGTLFLDEIGELPLPLQAQLLRAIQERTYKRVGGNQWLPTSFRLVCATNRDLQAEVGSGAFRSDLYYRIAGWSCELPPLSKRIEDILPLAAHFFRPNGHPADVFDPVVCDFLLRRAFPGNVRELKQLIERIRARHVEPGVVTIGALPEQERWCDAQDTGRRDEFERAIRHAMHRGVKLKELSQLTTDTAVRVVVQEEAGNLQRAAKRLGVTDRALQLRRANGSQVVS